MAVLKERMACIYRFYNPASGKSYIGMTLDEDARFKNHHSDAIGGRRKSRFYAAVRKYGWDAFEYSVLAVRPNSASSQWLPNAERLAIAMYDSFLNGYNATPGGEEGPMLVPEVAAKVSAALKGHAVSKDTRRKISVANTGKKHTAEAREKMSRARKGKKQTPEHAAKRGLAVRGEKNGNFGKTAEANPMFGRSRPDLAASNKLRVGALNPRFSQKDTPETKAKRIAGQVARRERERAARLVKSDTP